MEMGDRLLEIMKEKQIGIKELSVRTKIAENTILDILAGIREPDVASVCRLADGLGICVHELKTEEEPFFVPLPKETLAKLLVISVFEDTDVEEVIFHMLEKEIAEHVI